MIRTVQSPVPRDVWEDILRTDPESLVYQSPQWLDAMCAADGFEDASRVYYTQGGKTLVMPLVRKKGLTGSLATYASHPSGWGMGGLLASEAVQPEDVAAVTEDLLSLDSFRVSVRPNPLQAPMWESAMPDGVIRLPRVAHVLKLDEDFERVWMDRFKSGTRRAVRKAEQSGLEVECDTTGRLLPVFYGMLLASFERWAEGTEKPVNLSRWWAQRRDPLSKFQQMSDSLGAMCQVWVASLDGEPAASLLVLRGNNANYSRGAMYRDLAGPTQANALLQKMAIEDACQAGCRWYHMGETGASSSLAQFKERFGAEPVAHSEYLIEKFPVTPLKRSAKQAVKGMLSIIKRS